MDYFNDMKQSLNEAIAFKNGNIKKARMRTIKVITTPVYNSSDVMRVRSNLRLCQRGIALTIGVSPRTEEPWEAGRNIPNRTACRLMYLFEKDESLIDKIIE